MAPRSKHGIYENVYEVVGLVGREEKGAKDIHDENATLCSNPSKWEDLATDRGCFISRTNCFVMFLYFSIAFVFYFSSRFSSIYFFIINCILFLRHCCKLIRFYPLGIISFHTIQDNRLKFSCEPIHSESIADFTALLAQGWTVGYSQRFTAKRVTRSRVDPPLMRLNRSTLRTWTACR